MLRCFILLYLFAVGQDKKLSASCENLLESKVKILSLNHSGLSVILSLTFLIFLLCFYQLFELCSGEEWRNLWDLQEVS